MAEAVFPGSFDPLTHGHIDIILRACVMFDTVTVAVLDHPSKVGFFSVPERIKLMRAELKDLAPKARVDSFSGLLVDYLKTRKARVIIRGLRAISDYDYEVQMALMNKSLSEDVETVFLVARETNSFISSSIVRQVATLGGDIAKFVPRRVADAVLAKIKAEGKRKR
jgi:pantetheine-phosphate adenylyltransferase